MSDTDSTTIRPTAAAPRDLPPILPRAAAPPALPPPPPVEHPRRRSMALDPRRHGQRPTAESDLRRLSEVPWS